MLQVENLESAATRALGSGEVSRTFAARGEGRYLFDLPDIGVSVEVDRLRREHRELVGELSVRCDLAGARAVNGNLLSVADLNLSSARARLDRAKFLAQRANANEIDWTGILEEFAQRVLMADRSGTPAVDLRTLERPSAADALEVEAFRFPRRHPTLLFGDGGSGKSYVALWLAGRMAERGLSVALFDWELAGEDHRDRLERLFSDGMPRIVYAKCEKPLVSEVDRLRRIVVDEHIDYAVFDSVAVACDGPPEAAECASAYFRALRGIGVGSLNIAHVSKQDGADRKPFGSAFWHNLARSTWYVKLADSSADTECLSLGFFNRKSNLGRIQQPVGYEVMFSDDRTEFRRTSVADNPDMSGQLSVRQRMVHVLKRGAMTFDEIASEVDARRDTVMRESRRYKRLFCVLPGGKVGLVEARAS